MGAVAVAQDLHAMVAKVNDNNVAGGIERDASGTLELTCSRSLAADGADVGAVTVANNLHSMVAAVGNNKVALAVKRNAEFAAKASCELPVAAASAADGAHEGAVAHSKHLHATVAMVKNSDVALAVHSDAGGIGKLPVA